MMNDFKCVSCCLVWSKRKISRRKRKKKDWFLYGTYHLRRPCRRARDRDRDTVDTPLASRAKRPAAAERRDEQVEAAAQVSVAPSIPFHFFFFFFSFRQHFPILFHLLPLGFLQKRTGYEQSPGMSSASDVRRRLRTVTNHRPGLVAASSWLLSSYQRSSWGFPSQKLSRILFILFFRISRPPTVSDVILLDG